MTELFKLTVVFSNDDILEIFDVEKTHENLVAGFIRVESIGAEWILFFDQMKYLVQVPQSSKGSTNND